MTDIKKTMLEEAGNIVDGARRKNYGTPERNFIRIARFWQAYFDNTGRKIEITAADVSPMMRLMKEARLCESPDHYDSHVDIIGYTLTGAEVNEVTTVKPVESIGAGVVEKVGKPSAFKLSDLKTDRGGYIGLTRSEAGTVGGTTSHTSVLGTPVSDSNAFDDRVALGGHTAEDYVADPNSYQHRIGKPEQYEK